MIRQLPAALSLAAAIAIGVLTDSYYEMVAGAFGAIIGSFLNVCIHRLPLRKSIVFPASACPHCKHELDWFENLPIVSYLWLRGRCRSCGKPISLRYPIVEAITAAMFV